MTRTRTGTQAIDRAAELLVRVVESDDAPSVGELAEASGLPKSTTSRLLSALERQGLLQRDAQRSALLPGPVLLRYARRERTDPDLIELTVDVLDRLAERSGETVNLAVAAGDHVEQLDQRDSRHYLGSTNWVGRGVPFHATAGGKVFLALGTADVPSTLERITDATVVDRDALERELGEVRRHGYATTRDELEPGLWAVAAPILGADGSAVAAITISGPTVRLREGMLDDLAGELKREAAVVSARLGQPHLTKGAA
ncbi:MAG: IclR family transcriptional regulator [Gaiellales bacterium]